MTERDRIISGLSDEEVLQWRELFGYWPPVRGLSEDRWRQLYHQWLARKAEETHKSLMQLRLDAMEREAS